MGKNLKRFIAAFIAICMAITSINFSGLFDIDSAKAYSERISYNVLNPYGTGYFYQDLSDKEKAAYDSLQKVITEDCYGTYISFYNNSGAAARVDFMSVEEASRVLQAYMCDHPEIFWANTYNYKTNINGDVYEIGLANIKKYASDRNFSLTAKQKEIDEVAAEILKACAFLRSDFEKAEYIYNWLGENVEYRYDENGKPSKDEEAHSIYGALVEKSAVCEGYSKAFAYLANACGIPVTVILGDSIDSNNELQRHEWNAVMLDGKWYYVDATWGGEKYKFIATNDENFNANHMPDKEYEDFYLKTINENPSTSNYKFSGNRTGGPRGSFVYINNKSGYKLSFYNNGIMIDVAPERVSTTYERVYMPEGLPFQIKAASSTQKVKVTFEKSGAEVPADYKCIYADKIIIEAVSAEVTGVSLDYQIGKIGRKYSRRYNVYTDVGTFNKTVDISYISGDYDDKIAELENSGVYHALPIYDFAIPGPRRYSGKIDMSGTGVDNESPYLYINDIIENPRTFKLAFEAPEGVNIVATADNGKQYFNGSNVPGGTIITLSVQAADGINSGEFYYTNTPYESNDIKTGSNSYYGSEVSDYHLTDGKFIMLENTKIKLVREGLVIDDISLSENEFDVENGTQPYPYFLGLPQVADCTYGQITASNGKIAWDLSNYDPLDKTARDVTVTGIVTGESGTNFAEGVSNEVTAVLHVKAAKELADIITEIPSALTVDKGTERSAFSLGLPVRGEFIDENGETVVSEIVWSEEAGGDGTYVMKGFVKRAGYHYPDIEVTVTEEGETLNELPEVNITYTVGGAEVTKANPAKSENFVARVSLEIIDIHKDKKIVVSVPNGFKNVGVANASLYEGVKTSETIKNDDGSTDIVIEVEDDFDKGVLTFEISMASSFSSSTANSLGALYPAKTNIPIIVNYEAEENGKKLNSDIDYTGRLLAGGGELSNYYENFVFSVSSSIQDIVAGDFNYGNWGMIPSQTKNDSYYIGYKAFIPVPDFVDKFTRTSNSGTKYGFDYNYNTDDHVLEVTRNSYAIYDGTKNIGYFIPTTNDPDSLVAGKTYTTEMPLYSWAIDNFGNEYYYVRQPNSFKIAEYDSNIDLNIYGVPSKGPVYPTLDTSYSMYVSPGKNSFVYSSSNTSLSSLPVQDFDMIIEVPDGSSVGEFRTQFSGITGLTVEYHDGTKKEIGVNELKSTKDVAPDSDFSERYYVIPEEYLNLEGDGMKTLTIHYGKILDYFNSVISVIDVYATYYSDGTKVYPGTYYNNDQDTDCPMKYGRFVLKYGNQEKAISFMTYYMNDCRKEWYIYAEDNAVLATSDEKEFGFYSRFDYVVESTFPSGSFNATNMIAHYDVIDATGEICQLNQVEVTWHGKKAPATVAVYYDDGSYDIVDEIEFEESEVIKVPEDRYIIKVLIQSEEVGDREFAEVYFDGVVFDEAVRDNNLENEPFKAVYCHVSSDYIMPEADYSSLTYYTKFERGFRYYQKVGGVEYSTSSGSLTAISGIKQKDSAYVTMLHSLSALEYFLDTYSVEEIPDYVHRFDTIKMTATFSNSSVELDESELPYYVDYTGEKIYATSVVRNGNQYTIEFNNLDIKMTEYYPVVFKVKPSITATTGHTDLTVKLVNAVASADDQPYFDELPISEYIEDFYVDKLNEGYLYKATVSVLSAFTESADLYGKTKLDPEMDATSYRVEDGDTFDAIVHVFGGKDDKLEKFSAVINVPKTGDIMTINDSDYESRFDAVFKSVKASQSIVNPVYYYSYDGEEYIEFSGSADDIAEPENVLFIKVESDSAKNGDEITLTCIADAGEKLESVLVRAEIGYHSTTANKDFTFYTKAVVFTTKPDGETLVPVEPTPTDPVEPTPTDPVEPTPTDPVEPTPTDPVEPTPTDPVEPTPTDPAEPTPTDPAEPTPTDPVEPTPTDPAEPIPTDPVVTDTPIVTDSPAVTDKPSEAPATSADADSKEESPKTGDNLNLLALIFAAGLSFAALVLSRKKEK